MHLVELFLESSLPLPHMSATFKCTDYVDATQTNEEFAAQEVVPESV